MRSVDISMSCGRARGHVTTSRLYAGGRRDSSARSDTLSVCRGMLLASSIPNCLVTVVHVGVMVGTSHDQRAECQFMHGDHPRGGSIPAHGVGVDDTAVPQVSLQNRPIPYLVHPRI